MSSSSRFRPYRRGTLFNSNPLEFSFDDYTTESTRHDVIAANMTPQAALKAGGLRVAASDIKGILRDLKPYAGTAINKLPERAKNKFNRLAIYVQALYNTNDYETFYSLVQGEYGHLKTTYPNTVGSYMIGCNVTTSLSGEEAGCAIACAASIPRPQSDKTFRHCSNTVIHANYDGAKYNFSVLRRAERLDNHKDAYLYVNSSSSEGYPGFGDNEKKILVEWGIERVKVYGFDSDGRNYVELTNDLVPISKLKSRNRHHNDYSDNRHNRPKPYHHPQHENSNGSWIPLLIVIILIIVVAVGIYYYYFHMRHPGQQLDQHNYYNKQYETPSSPLSDEVATTP